MLCLQGESYADEFLRCGARGDCTADAAVADGVVEGKKYAFTQFAYPPTKVKGVDMPENFRQGYTVRSSDGYRYTEYVDYDPVKFQGHWTDTPIDAELYDLNADQWETTNAAAEPGQAGKVRELMAALRAQYSPVGGSN